MIEFVYVPVPSEHVMNVLRFLATQIGTPESGALGPVERSTTRVSRQAQPPTGEGSRTLYISDRLLERCKSAVKRLDQPFSQRTLAREASVTPYSARAAIFVMTKQGWLADEGFRRSPRGGRAHMYRYLPAPELPQPKREDPSDVTGRGKVKANGTPVPGTGKRDAPRGEMGRMISALRAQGWTVERTGGNHYKVSRGGRGPVIIPATPSDPRSVTNARAELRKAGANL